MTEGYHYTGCGLDYVYLQNGFEGRETKHGTGVAIKNVAGLHESIARCIVAAHRAIGGQEVRFLRAQLKVSQDGLAHILGTKRGSVARWEAKPNHKIPGTADRALRMFYSAKHERPEFVAELIEMLTELDEIENNLAISKQAVFRDTSSGWRQEPRSAVHA